MSEASDIGRAAADVLRQMTAPSDSVPDLTLKAATPLVTLPPDLVDLVVGRVQAGASALGADHPREAITRRIVLPSAALAVLDAAGLIAAIVTGHVVLAVATALLLLVLAYLAFAGVRFVRADPLRVTSEQRARVDAAKEWRSDRPWTEEKRAGPWGRLVGVACVEAARIAAGDAWTWPSIAGQRAATEPARVLDGVDAEAFALASEAAPVPASVDASSAGAALVRRVGALQCYADALDDLVRRAAEDSDLRVELSRTQDQRLTDLLTAVRESRGGKD